MLLLVLSLLSWLPGRKQKARKGAEEPEIKSLVLELNVGGLCTLHLAPSTSSISAELGHLHRMMLAEIPPHILDSSMTRMDLFQAVIGPVAIWPH